MVLPIVIWIMRDQFDTIPIELDEAALVDGLSVWGAFFRIVLPIALPGMVAAFILSLILCWNEYFFAALLTSSNAKTLPVMVASQTGSQGINWWVDGGALDGGDRAAGHHRHPARALHHQGPDRGRGEIAAPAQLSRSESATEARQPAARKCSRAGALESRGKQMISRVLAIAAIVAALSGVAAAAEDFDEFSDPFDAPDLQLPDQPQMLAAGRSSMMFKPDGAGPFPALVIMPTCYGHLYSVNTFDWARRAVSHGYAALVVDPLARRGVESNCDRPLRVPASRLLKDAFDAAEHLRRQPFVDPARVGMLGFSQGAMTGLGAAGALYSRPNGREPFRAIVSVYPVCLFENFPMPGRFDPVDMRFVPEKIVVPLLVEIGDEDTQGGPAMSGCKRLLDKRKRAATRSNTSSIARPPSGTIASWRRARSACAASTARKSSTGTMRK